ncbi:MAG: hypothetical protein HQL99_05015 [Magnetococcales bacterium]|nr:hypothetical protein [Magnetococcales bacterium]
MTVRQTQGMQRPLSIGFRGWFLLVTAGLTGTIPPATAFGAEAAEVTPLAFSAEVIRTRPDKKSQNQTRGRLHVSPEAIRGESQRNGVTVIMIHHTARKTVWTLIPSQKSYTERTGVESARPPLPDEPNSPCRHDKNLICRQTGTETIDGRRTLRWEIGTRGSDHRETLQAHLWIDPRLGMAIRERYADGLSVELSNIQEGPQPPELFTVPENFQKTASTPSAQTPPQSGTHPPAGGQSSP